MIDTRKKTEHGFTLVELSIVLVIIGLIVGGILVGQDMINAARARSVVSQIEKYNSAVNVFQEKYGKIAGDYDKAVANITGVTAGHNGDGNGAIGAIGSTGSNIPTTPLLATTEYPFFFEHLSKANLIDGNFDGTFAVVSPGVNFAIPKTGVGGMIAYTDASNIKRWFLGLQSDVGAALTYGTAATTGQGVLKTTEAFSVDTKMDDARADKGIVVAQDSPSVAASIASNCVTNLTGDYALGELGTNCRLNIRMN